MRGVDEDAIGYGYTSRREKVEYVAHGVKSGSVVGMESSRHASWWRARVLILEMDERSIGKRISILRICSRTGCEDVLLELKTRCEARTSVL